MLELNVWNMITNYYVSSPVWMVFAIAAIVYIIINLDKPAQKKMLLCILLSILFILNEVSYNVLIRLFDEASYYRFLWSVPYGMVVAYALTHCVLSIIREKRGRSGTILGLLFVAFVVAILYVTQGNYIVRLMDNFPQNKYLVADDILEIRAILNEERVNGNCTTEPVIACPRNVMMEYQTIDAGCTIVTNRVVYLQVREYGADVATLQQGFKDGYILSTVCEDNAQPEVIDIKAAIARQQVGYIIVNANAGMEDYMTSLDCTLAGTTQSYLVYRYVDFKN